MHERTGSHGAADRAALPTDSAPAHDRPQLDGHRGTHAHLWMLPDGTGLHAPYGQLVRDPHTGQVCCHLCGELFRLLGSHLRRHGISADDYRHEMGLCRTRALASAEVSQAISRRQAQAYRRSAEVRERLAVGNQLAQFGQLAWRARRAGSDERSAEFLARRQISLARGRATRQLNRDLAVAARLKRLGYSDLGHYLRSAYTAGASLNDLRAATGLGSRRLAQEMASYGIAVRRPGQTPLEGRRSRARRADQEAAARVGTDDIVSWLSERHDAGWSMTRLGNAVGHSAHWVRWRLIPERSNNVG